MGLGTIQSSNHKEDCVYFVTKSEISKGYQNTYMFTVFSFTLPHKHLIHVEILNFNQTCGASCGWCPFFTKNVLLSIYHLTFTLCKYTNLQHHTSLLNTNSFFTSKTNNPHENKIRYLFGRTPTPT